METIVKTIGVLFGALFAVLLVIVFVALILSLPVWLLWNWVAVAVLGLKEITLMQAVGLTFLASFLFKSISVSSKS